MKVLSEYLHITSDGKDFVSEIQSQRRSEGLETEPLSYLLWDYKVKRPVQDIMYYGTHR